MNTITTNDCVSERSIMLMSILGDMRLVVAQKERGQHPFNSGHQTEWKIQS